jgi:hypothetical protein
MMRGVYPTGYVSKYRKGVTQKPRLFEILILLFYAHQPKPGRFCTLKQSGQFLRLIK